MLRLTLASLLAFTLAAPVLGERELLSFAPADPHDLAAAASAPAALGSDGRFVLLASLAPNLVAGATDTNGCADLVLVDRLTGTRRLVSHEPGQPNVALAHGASPGDGGRGLLAENGRVVLFRHANDVLCPFAGVNPWFLADLETGALARLSDLVAVPGLGAAVTLVPRALSADGQRVVLDYTVAASGATHVVLYDRGGGTSRLVSHATGAMNTPANGSSAALAATPDGRFVLFTSAATNLVTGFAATHGHTDLYRFDATTGSSILVSRVFGTTTSGASGANGSITPNGDSIAFDSWGPNLVAGQSDSPDTPDAFTFEVSSGVTRLVGHAAGLPAVTAGGHVAGVSDDGRYTLVAMPNLLATGGIDRNGPLGDLFLHDRDTDESILVDRAAGTLDSADAGAEAVGLSSDGRFVFFTSTASDLVAGGVPSSLGDLFRFERTTGSVELVSHRPGQPALGAGALRAVVSADGLLAAAASPSPDLAAPLTDGNHAWDTFAFEPSSGLREALSTAAFPVVTTAAGDSEGVRVAAEGGVVGYRTASLEMVPGLGAVAPTGAPWGVVYDRLLRRHELVTHAAGQPGTPRPGVVSALSGDGRFVVLDSAAEDLVPGQLEPLDGTGDAFLYDRATDGAQLVSHLAGQPSHAAGDGRGLATSDDGRSVLWVGATDGVVAGVLPHGVSQLFLFDRTTGQNRLVSHGFGGATEAADAAAWSAPGDAALSADGTRVLFRSAASNLAAGDLEVRHDVFLFDADTGQLRLLPQPAGFSVPRGPVLLAADGRFAAFAVIRSGVTSLYSWDALSGLTTGVAQGADLVPRDLSADGRFLLYDTRQDLAALGFLDGNGDFDAVVHDRIINSDRLATPRRGSSTQTGPLGGSAVAFVDGARVLVRTADATLLPAGATATGDELVQIDLASGRRELLSHRPGQPLTGAGLGWEEVFAVAVSRRGATLAFAAEARGLATYDFDFGNSAIPPFVPGGTDVFLYRPDDLFADGFESGNLAAWSSAEP